MSNQPRNTEFESNLFYYICVEISCFNIIWRCIPSDFSIYFYQQFKTERNLKFTHKQTCIINICRKYINIFVACYNTHTNFDFKNSFSQHKRIPYQNGKYTCALTCNFSFFIFYHSKQVANCSVILLNFYMFCFCFFIFSFVPAAVEYFFTYLRFRVDDL